MQTLLWLFLGLVLGLPFVAFTRKLSEEKGRRVLALGLVAAALVYTVFAATGGAAGWIPIELVGVLIFSVFAERGVKGSAMWLAAGWALHPLWDAGLHLSGVGARVAPPYYVLACIGFDVLVAAYIFLMRQRRLAARLH